MFRRIRNPAFQPNPLPPAQMQTLSRANQLLAGGQPLQAAALFTQLADQLQVSNHPRRAANLHAQAAHAFADGQDEADALAQARLALSLFLQYQMVRRTPVFYANITRKLNAKGMKNAADALMKEFGSKVGPIPASVAPPTGHGRLPTNCPKCGAPIHGDEAEWVDTSTAECAYCGTLIRSE